MVLLKEFVGKKMTWMNTCTSNNILEQELSNYNLWVKFDLLSIFIKFCWNRAWHTYLYTVYDCFHARAFLRTWSPVAYKDWNIYHRTLQSLLTSLWENWGTAIYKNLTSRGETSVFHKCNNFTYNVGEVFPAPNLDCNW